MVCILVHLYSYPVVGDSNTLTPTIHSTLHIRFDVADTCVIPKRIKTSLVAFSWPNDHDSYSHATVYGQILVLFRNESKLEV